MKSQRWVAREPGGGFTLLELAVAVAVFAVVAAFSAPIFTNLTTFYTDSLFRSGVMETAKVAQENLFDDLTSAKVLSLNTTGTFPVLTYVVPVFVANGGPPDYVDPNGNVNWGCVESTGPKLDATGSPHRLTLTAATTGSISEKTIQLDINGDGDRLDTFLVGSILLQTSGGLQKTLSSSRAVLKEVGKTSFDMNKDGVADPLFQVKGETFTDTNANGIHDLGEAYVDLNLNGVWDGSLTVNILAFGTDRRGRGQVYLYRTTVRLLSN